MATPATAKPANAWLVDPTKPASYPVALGGGLSKRDKEARILYTSIACTAMFIFGHLPVCSTDLMPQIITSLAKPAPHGPRPSSLLRPMVTSISPSTTRTTLRPDMPTSVVAPPPSHPPNPSSSSSQPKSKVSPLSHSTGSLTLTSLPPHGSETQRSCDRPTPS
jgi:hypothetical protein